MNSAAWLERLEHYLLEVVRGRRHDAMAQVVKGVLFIASRLFRGIVQLRLGLYGRRILRPHMLGCLVVSFGNITVGGTGKTPITEIFARTLTANGRRVAILSRGYRSRSQPLMSKLRALLWSQEHEIPPKVVSRGDGSTLPLLGSDEAGDEPYMLAKNVPSAVVLVDKDRVKSGRYAIRQFQCDTLLLDDGFQQLRMKPQVNILLVDSTNPFSNHQVLPRGLLREPIKNIKRANYIFLTKSNGGAHLRHLKAFIRRHNNRAEIIECTHSPKYMERIDQPGRSGLEALRGRKVAALSGIAVPEGFERFVRDLGAEIVYTERFSDHYRFETEELDAFQRQAKAAGAELAVTTEKDAVRFGADLSYLLPTWYMRVEIDILAGQESFDQCIARICFAVRG